MYLLALSYYFVIVFLGYNGKLTSNLVIHVHKTDCRSVTLPEPDRDSTGTNTSLSRLVVHQSVHL